ncbi:MAG: chemotaxis protein [Gammaproteobacteria bacterium]|nr:chemotaxis protein [Gammaproteobacteria bacterium]PCH62669.1 MAG: chemotaxis protein [Gammaproteobacteria bacterium]
MLTNSDANSGDKPQSVAADTRTLDKSDYPVFCDYLESLCGIVLGENKQYLVTSRLAPLLDEYSFQSFSQLIALVIEDKKSTLASRVVDAMTTNETSWFRDQFPFELLKHHILPDMIEMGRRRVSIWSAACSSGQEPYSISMAITEFLDAHPKCFLNPRVVSTDISPAILDDAKKGVYDAAAISRGLNSAQKKRFFNPVKAGFEVGSEVKNRVSFQLLDLQQGYAALGKQDIIFCRNVLIYFSSQLRDNIIERMVANMNPKGYLYLGASESLGSFTRHFRTVRGNGGSVHQLK